jgi:hypothetical protein
MSLRAAEALTAAQDAHDRELGLGPEGPLLAALRDELPATTIAKNARGLVEATVDDAGHVVAIAVIDVDQDRRAWEELARRALEALRGRSLRMPPGATGATMEVEVTSRYVMPSGRDPGVALDVFGVPVHDGDGPRSTHIGIVPHPIPRIAPVTLDDPLAGQPIRLPNTRFTWEAASFDGDPVDVGARPRRVVATRLKRTAMIRLPAAVRVAGRILGLVN